MSELKTSGQPDAPSTESHGHAVDLNNYIRTCAYVFLAVICATALMIWISFLPEHYSWAKKVGMILVVACANAFVVRSEEHTSELQSHRDLHSFPTRRSSDLCDGADDLDFVPARTLQLGEKSGNDFSGRVRQRLRR